MSKNDGMILVPPKLPMESAFQEKLKRLGELFKLTEVDMVVYRFMTSGPISCNIFRRPHGDTKKLDRHEAGRYIALENHEGDSFAIAFGTDLITDENKSVQGFKYDGLDVDYENAAEHIVTWLSNGSVPALCLN